MQRLYDEAVQRYGEMVSRDEVVIDTLDKFFYYVKNVLSTELPFIKKAKEGQETVRVQMLAIQSFIEQLVSSPNGSVSIYFSSVAVSFPFLLG